MRLACVGPIVSVSPDPVELRHATDDLFAVFAQTKPGPVDAALGSITSSVATPSVLISSLRPKSHCLFSPRTSPNSSCSTSVQRRHKPRVHSINTRTQYGDRLPAIKPHSRAFMRSPCRLVVPLQLPFIRPKWTGIDRNRPALPSITNGRDRLPLKHVQHATRPAETCKLLIPRSQVRFLPGALVRGGT
jgi:hypothetical protein